MEETNTKKNNIISEFKALVLMLMVFLGYLYIDYSKLLYFSIFVSLVLISLKLYIRENDLAFTKHLFMLIMSLYNVTSLFFMVEYFIAGIADMDIFKVLLMPFFDGESFNIAYIIWTFILTTFLLVGNTKLDRVIGDDNGR